MRKEPTTGGHRAARMNPTKKQEKQQHCDGSWLCRRGICTHAEGTADRVSVTKEENDKMSAQNSGEGPATEQRQQSTKEQAFAVLDASKWCAWREGPDDQGHTKLCGYAGPPVRHAAWGVEHDFVPRRRR